jgi:rRNA methylase, putative, group 3
MTDKKYNDEDMAASDIIEGRNAVLEAVRSGRTIDKVFIQEGIQDNTISVILSKLKGTGTVINRVGKQRLDQMSETGHHQGVIARCAAYQYSEIEDIFKKAEEKGEDPFIFILDEIEDPHNLGAIIRTANLSGAHGVIIPKHRASGITAVVAKASAGALNYTPVVKVTNISKTIEELKERGIWFACADMDGEVMYRSNLKGPIGIVIGNEGKGVSRLVRDKCDYVVSIPMKGDIDSLNASVAAGVLAFEVVRQRMS